jgi:crotonobetainyl-CoA:carnitine CoA-transferase CaiB-like acyl-CoA transferase
MRGPLSPLRVIELCDDVEAAYCARQFAAWGAAVTTLEPASGSPLRRRQPIVTTSTGEKLSCLWEYVAAGKASQVYRDQAALAAVLGDLLPPAQVLITDWRTARLANAGLSLQGLSSRYPALVVVSITPFGNSGPYAELQATDLIVQALASFSSFNGLPNQAPLKAPANVLAYAVGVSAFVGALAAVHHLLSAGAGQVVEVSAQEAVASLVQTLRTEYWGQPLARTGGPQGGTLMLESRDGYVSFNPVADGVWPKVAGVLGIADEEIPEALKGGQAIANRQELARFLSRWTRQFRASDLFEFLNLLGVITGRLNSPSDLLDDPHLAARGFFFEVSAAKGGTCKFPGAPARFSRSPMPSPSKAPALGQNVDRPNRLPEPPARRGAQSPSAQPPLAGIKVADLAQAWIGSYATMLLAHLGADIVKVESPTRPDIWRGDMGRQQPQPVANPDAHLWNTNPSFNSVNRDKKSLALDLATPGGRDAFLRLVTQCDLVTENFSPRVIDNLDLTYEILAKVRPGLIMVSFSGYGRSGPYRDYKANGAVIETTAGWDNYLGYPSGPPMMMGTMQADAITGLQMAACTLVALIYRDLTGEGQYVEGSMFESAIGYIGEEVVRASYAVSDSERRGNRSLDYVPQGIFATAEKDRWLALSVRNDDEWRRFTALTGVRKLLAPRFRALRGRSQHVDEIEELVGRWTAGRDADDLMTRLQEAGLAAAAVHDTKTLFEDRQLTARDWFQIVEHPDMGRHRYNGFPWRFSRTPPIFTSPSPRLGQHTLEVLRGRLGFTRDEVAELVKSGAAADVLTRAHDTPA